ncbi:UDP-glucose/GDP-mannose dehydrogenase family protein [Terrabacter carboxydivorans]|uniref:UDP-glucose 6-dehydrogenase n=1 Tax=Terrabacter carboxydivorans TaxID=619730 RepID=A0ABN3M0C7_9MICO
MKISVIGCGYLGAVHAACMADFGHDVVGVDVDPAKVDKLAAGIPSFHEPGLEPLLRQGVEKGSLRFTTDKTSLAGARVHFIAVGTPQRGGSYAADMSYIWSAVDDIIGNATPHADGPLVVVGKSTVPVGTAAAIAERLEEAGVDAVVVWNPEFLREGHAVQDTERPDRVVYGLPDDRERGEVGRSVVDEVYAPIIEAGTPRLLVNYPTAELVKVAANSFLATKISFINSMAELCDVSGADVSRLAEAIGHDDRIGSKFLQAGIGFGGGCLPKDIRAFMARAGELGVDQSLTFLREVDSINMRRRDHAVELATQMAGGRLVGLKVAVLGLTFKPDSDDVRDSPALDIAGRLWGRGANVVATDPAGADAVRGLRPDLHIVDSADEALAGADLVMLLTAWKDYVELDPTAARSLVATPRIIDGRNVLDPRAWADAGWDYRGMGRRSGAVW